MTRIVVNNAQEFVAAMMEHQHARCEAADDGRSIIVYTDKTSKSLGAVLRHGLRAVFAPTRLHDDQAVAVSRILRYWATSNYEPGNPNNFFKGFGTGVLSNKKINDAHAIKDCALSAAARAGTEANLRKLRKWELRVNAYTKDLGANATVRDLLENELGSGTGSNSSINTIAEAAALADEYPKLRAILNKRVFTDFNEDDHQRLQEIVKKHKDRVLNTQLDTLIERSESMLSDDSSVASEDSHERITNTIARRYGNLATLGVHKKPQTPSTTPAAPTGPAAAEPAVARGHLARPKPEVLESITVAIPNVPLLDEDKIVATEREVDEELNETYFSKLAELGNDVTATMAAMAAHVRVRYDQEVVGLEGDYEAAVTDQDAGQQIRLAYQLSKAQARSRFAAEWIAIREGRSWGVVKNPDPKEGGNLRLDRVENRIALLNTQVKAPYFGSLARLADYVAATAIEEGRTLGTSFKVQKNGIVKNEYTQAKEVVSREVVEWEPPTFYGLYDKSSFLDNPGKVGQLEKKIGSYTILNWYGDFLKGGAPTDGNLRNLYTKDRHRLVAERNHAQAKLNLETRTKHLQNALANFNEANREIIELRGVLVIQANTGVPLAEIEKTRAQLDEVLVDANDQKQAYVEATTKLNLAKIEAQAAKEYFEALNQEDTAVFTSLIQKSYLATY